MRLFSKLAPRVACRRHADVLNVRVGWKADVDGRFQIDGGGRSWAKGVLAPNNTADRIANGAPGQVNDALHDVGDLAVILRAEIAAPPPSLRRRWRA
jgi:hypothetical protein